MFPRILKQSFLQNKKQKILAILTILLSASLMTALLNTSIGIGDKMTSELKAYGANIIVIPKSETLSLDIGGVDYNPLKDKTFLLEKDLPNVKDIFWRNNIVAFAPYLKKSIYLSDFGNQKIKIIGTYFDKNVKIPDEEDYITGTKYVKTYWSIEGKWARDDSLDALVGINLAKELNLKIGDTLTVHHNDTDIKLTVSGILTSGEDADDGVVASLKSVQKLFNLEGKLNSINVSALSVPEDELSRKSRRNPDSLDSLEYDNWYCTAYVSSIAYQIEENVPNAAVKPIWQVAASEGVIIEKIQLLMFVVIVAALFASAMGISSLLSSIILKRSKEIGLMKALGAKSYDIYLLFLSEAVIIGVIGGVLGYILGCFLGQVISYSIFGDFGSIKFAVFPVILTISVFIALLGSIIPSWMITKLLPVDVLYGRK